MSCEVGRIEVISNIVNELQECQELLGEEYGREQARENAFQIALRMLGLGKYGEEEIALITGLKLEDIIHLKMQKA